MASRDQEALIDESEAYLGKASRDPAAPKRVSLSMGIARYKKGMTAKELTDLGDKVMYVVKKGGKGWAAIGEMVDGQMRVTALERPQQTIKNVA